MMSSQIVVLILLIYLPFCQPQITECSAYVVKLINDILDFKITSIPTPSLMYSGITTNNAGQMQQCLYSNYSYYLVFTKNSTSMTETFRGICVPSQCTAADIQFALQFYRPRVYGVEELDVKDNVSFFGAILMTVWFSLVLVCSLFSYFKQPVVNEYLDKVDISNESGSGDHPSTQTFQSLQQGEIDIFNYYQGYKKIFTVSNNASPLSLILFLAVISFCISLQYSYRQITAENGIDSATQLNSTWGVFVCNVEISLHTIMFILGFRLPYYFIKVRKFTKIGRIFFDIVLKKWLNLIFMSILAYCFLTLCTSQPLAKLWHLNNGKDCPNYIWQIWFLFRNLQLDCKICLPWFTLLEADLLFTFLSAPLILVLRTHKKIGYCLTILLLSASAVFSLQILKNEGITFEPTKLMNAQKQYWIDYQGNSFVRMAPFFLGFIFGFFLTEATDKTRSKLAFENKIVQIFKKPLIQWLTTLMGFTMMIYCFCLIRPYLQPKKDNTNSFYYLIFTPFTFTFGLGLFILTSHLDQPTLLTKIICKVLGSTNWIHLQKMSLNYYSLFPMIAGYSVFSSQNSIKYSIWVVTIYLIGDLFITYFLCILVTASVENQLIPLIQSLKKRILGKQTRYSDIMVQFV